MNDDALAAAYRHCEQLARQHYENFPIASWFLTPKLQQAITVIYAFERLSSLEQYEYELNNIQRHPEHTPSLPLFLALQDVILKHQLPLTPFQDLLSAFKQDVTQKNYQNTEQLLDYCRRSANPIGHLLLHLNRETDTDLLKLSDQICSALQLVNLYQDVSQDFKENQRIYIPRADLGYVDIDNFIPTAANSLKLSTALREKYQASAKMLMTGLPLGQQLSGRLAWQVRITVLSALMVLVKLSEQDNHKLFSRPRLNKIHFLRLSLLASNPFLYTQYADRLYRRISCLNQENK